MKEPRTYQELRELERCAHIENFHTHFNEEEIQNEYRPRLQAAFTKLYKFLHNPKRDRGAMWSSMYLLSLAAPIVRPQDIPVLIELASIARHTRGAGAQDTEEYALQLLLEVSNEQVLPFWVESFNFLRPRDRLSNKRRMYAVKAATVTALLEHKQEAINLVLKGLTHKNAKTRRATIQAIDEIKKMAALTLLPLFIEKLQRLANKDKAPEVRHYALLALK